MARLAIGARPGHRGRTCPPLSSSRSIHRSNGLSLAGVPIWSLSPGEVNTPGILTAAAVFSSPVDRPVGVLGLDGLLVVGEYLRTSRLAVGLHLKVRGDAVEKRTDRG